MNKKKNQTSIGLDAIITEVLNLFTPEEQQELINILSNNGLEKLYQQMEEAFYDYQQPDYSSEATPIATYLQRLWDMKTRKDYPLDEFKKDCTTVPAAELEKDLRNFILQLFIQYQGPLENEIEEEERQKNTVQKQITEILAIIVLIIYLFISFTTMAWHITWVIFIISEVICQIVKLIFMLNEKEGIEDEK